MMGDEAQQRHAMAWFVCGEEGMSLHGFMPENQDDPAVRVTVTDKGFWVFTFNDRPGQGRIQVRTGCDYNPLDLIESMYHHVVTNAIAEDSPITFTDDEKNPFGVSFDPEDWA